MFKFVVDDVKYFIPNIEGNDFYENDNFVIELPDSRCIAVASWLESFPPIPSAFEIAKVTDKNIAFIAFKWLELS